MTNMHSHVQKIYKYNEQEIYIKRTKDVWSKLWESTRNVIAHSGKKTVERRYSQFPNGTLLADPFLFPARWRSASREDAEKTEKRKKKRGHLIDRVGSRLSHKKLSRRRKWYGARPAGGAAVAMATVRRTAVAAVVCWPWHSFVCSTSTWDFIVSGSAPNELGYTNNRRMGEKKKEKKRHYFIFRF